MSRDELLRLIDEQRRDYREALLHKFSEIDALLALFPDGVPFTVEVLNTLEREAHTMRGTAGSFGMASVSQAAGALESLVCDVSAQTVLLAAASIDGVAPTHQRVARAARALWQAVQAEQKNLGVPVVNSTTPGA